MDVSAVAVPKPLRGKSRVIHGTDCLVGEG